MKKILLILLTIAASSSVMAATPAAFTFIAPTCGTVFISAPGVPAFTIAANTTTATAPWLAVPWQGISLEFSSASTSSAQLDVYGTNNPDPGWIGVILTGSGTPNPSVANPSLAAPSGLFLSGYRAYRVQVSNYSSGTLMVSYCPVMAGQ